jgi:hypothetical protein
LDAQSKKIDDQTFKLIMEELEWDTKAMRVYFRNVDLHQTRELLQKTQWRKKRFEASRDAVEQWFEGNAT